MSYPLYGVMKTANKKSFLKNLLLGKGGPNPYSAALDAATEKSFLKGLSKTFRNVDDLSPSQIADLTASSTKDVKNLAPSLGLSERTLPEKIVTNIKSFPSDLKNVLVGSDKSRLGFLHKMHEGGLVGPGGYARSTFSPGKKFFEAIDPIKSHIKEKGLSGLADVPITPRQLGQIGVGAAKPFLWGGSLIIPTVGAYQAVSGKADPTKGRAENLLENLGAFSGSTLGIPLGTVGSVSGAVAGGKAGGTVGKSLDELLGTTPDKRILELMELRKQMRERNLSDLQQQNILRGKTINSLE